VTTGVAEAQLDVLVEIRDAVANLNKLQEEAKKSESSIAKSFETIKAAAIGLVAVLGAKQIVDFFASGIDAAQAQEKALASLSQQLKLAGDYSADAVKDFTEFADAMEESTTFGDDLVLSQLAVAKSFGVSNQQAKDLVQAATELSAVTGGDLESSVQTLGKTLTGASGKLGKTVDGFDSLTEAQLKAGKGIDYVIERLGGSQAAQLQTFGGSLTQLSNSFGNLQEVFGDLIVSNPTVIASIGAIKDVLNFLKQSVEANSDSLKAFISGALQVTAATAAGTAQALSFLAEVFQVLTTQLIDGVANFADLAGGLLSLIPGAEDAAKAFADFGDDARGVSEATNDSLGKVTQGFNAFQAAVDAGAQKIADADQRVITSSKATEQARASLARGEQQNAKERAKALEDLAKFEAKLRGESADANQKAIAAYAENLRQIAELEKTTAEGAAKGAELRKIAEENLIGTLTKLREEADKKATEDAKKAAEEQRAIIEGIAGNPLKVVISQFEISPVASKELQEGIAGAVGGANLLLGGKDGAKKAVAGLGAAAADAFVPGLGAAAGPLLEALAAGPEQTKAMVKGFIEAVPDIIDAIAESIPVVVDTLIDYLITRGGAVKIAIAIVKGMVQASFGVVEAIGKAIFGGIDLDVFGGIGDALSFDLASGITEGAMKLFEFDKMIRVAFLNGATQLFQGIVKGAKELFAFDQKLRQAGVAAAQSLFQAIQRGAQKLFEIDKKIREAAIAAVTSLYEGIRSALRTPDWLSSFISSVQNIFGTPQWVDYFKRIAEWLVDSISGTFSWFYDAISGTFDWFYNALYDVITWLPDAIASIFGGGGGGGGLVSGTGTPLDYLATGITEVPAGYPNDTYAAMLSSGERVVDADANRDLKSMLADYKNGQLSGGGGSDQLLLQIIALLERPVYTETELKVDNTAFANLMLKQSRRNARTA
jgi:hypothetical protein